MLQQNWDSAQRKIGCLNLTKLERNLKPAESKPDKRNCKAMLPFFESPIQIYNQDNFFFFFVKFIGFAQNILKEMDPLSCSALT